MSSKKQIDTIIESLQRGDKIHQNQVKTICQLAKQTLKQQNNVVYIKSPVIICGDIHGQFDDLLELFRIGGFPPFASYIFLGDYVDRGRDSVETFLLLLAFKVRYRNRITLLRGNHQSTMITQFYGFYDQCQKKYGQLNVWKSCTQVFNYLTLAAVINNKVFCVHGGLSPSIKTINDINQIQRVRQIPQQGPFCDLLWSDPDEIPGWANSNRGAGYLYGKQAVHSFCHQNGLILVARAHQLIMEGYKFMFDEKLVTVWSAPNYFYRCGNVASIMELDENLQRVFKIFQAAPQNSKKLPGSEIPHYFL